MSNIYFFKGKQINTDTLLSNRIEIIEGFENKKTYTVYTAKLTNEQKLEIVAWATQIAEIYGEIEQCKVTQKILLDSKTWTKYNRELTKLILSKHSQIRTYTEIGCNLCSEDGDKWWEEIDSENKNNLIDYEIVGNTFYCGRCECHREYSTRTAYEKWKGNDWGNI